MPSSSTPAAAKSPSPRTHIWQGWRRCCGKIHKGTGGQAHENALRVSRDIVTIPTCTSVFWPQASVLYRTWGFRPKAIHDTTALTPHLHHLTHLKKRAILQVPFPQSFGNGRRRASTYTSSHRPATAQTLSCCFNSHPKMRSIRNPVR